MSRVIPMLRLTPQAAGELQQQCTKATTDLQELTRFRKEFDRQLAELIGNDVLRKLHKSTRNALMLADLVKESDLTALATERRDLMPADLAVWDCLIGVEPMPETIRPWAATEARLTFHQRLMDQLAIEHRRKAA